jgi:2-oxoglutarate ferredoxin oxidoreductase subunit gamma
MEAVNLQNKKTMNMIMLGSYLGVKPIIPIDSILKALTQVLPERHHHLIPLNEKALRRGMELSKLPTEKEEA